MGWLQAGYGLFAGIKGFLASIKSYGCWLTKPMLEGDLPMDRRTFVTRSAIAALTGVAATGGYAHYVERHAVQVVPVELQLGLPQPITIALWSDIHFDPLFETDYLEKVVDLTNQQSPDLILMTGDFVSRSTDRINDLTAILKKAEAGLGRYASLGNHDHWVDAHQVTKALQAVDIPVLRNNTVPIPGCNDWYLSGLESVWGGKPDLASLQKTPTYARHLLMMHEPDTFDQLTDPRIALQVSGHTHGGQIRIPRYGAIKLPPFGKKYQAGLYSRESQHLYVQRGVGTVDQHVRMNCRPEITLMKLS